MQIHELNTFSGTPSASDYLIIDDGTDTSKIPATLVGTDTTYPTATQEQITAGTSTTPSVVTPKLLHDAILALFGDYITEQGTATHSTTGTWHYRKWHSGKIEAWNTYDVGSIPITTAGQGFGGYRSDQISISIPSDIFGGTPDGAVISKKGTQGGWLSNVVLGGNSVSTFACCEVSKTLASQSLVTYAWKN